MSPLDFLNKYISALVNPVGFVGEAQDVANKIQERNRMTEEAIDKLLRQPENQEY